jgi:hypothetical protein
LHIEEKKIDPQAFSPLIKKIVVDCGDYDTGIGKRNNLKNSLEIGEEYSLNMTADDTSRARMLTEARLDLNSLYAGIPTISKVGANNQPINQDQVEIKKVKDAYDRVKTAYSNRRNNLEEAIQSLKDLLKVNNKEGTEAEKNELARITTEYELNCMKAELVHNAYEKGGSYPIPDFNTLGTVSRSTQQNDETPTL